MDTQEQGTLQQELAKVNITDAIIADLKEEAGVVLASPITSDAEVLRVHGIRKKAKYMKVGGEKLFDHEISSLHKAHRAAIEKKKSVLAPIIEVEEQAKARIFEWEYKLEQEAKQREEARLKAIQERNTACMEMGFVLKDGVWTQDGMSVDAEEILKMDAERWEARKTSMRVIQAEAEERREKERLAALEVERLKKELEEREAALKLREQQMRDSRKEARKNELLTLGCEQNGDFLVLRHLSVVVSNLAAQDDDEWQATLFEASNQASLLKEEREAYVAKAAREALIKERAERLKAAGWEVRTHDGQRNTLVLVMADGMETEFYDFTFADMPDGDFERHVAMGNKVLARRKQVEEDRIRQEERDRIERERLKAEQQAAEAEAQRLAADGDKEYIRQALLIVTSGGAKIAEMIPKTQTKEMRDVLSIARSNFLETHAMLTKVMNQ